MDWREINTTPSDAELNAFGVFFVPPGNYIFGTPSDIQMVKKEYPLVTHYKILEMAPMILAKEETTRVEI